MSSKTYREALADAMHNAMDNYDNTIIIGQGVADFKGLFGTTSNLAKKYPKRVIETPLAEDSIAGICLGAALNGIYPINTHIRADFGLLVFNQLINLGAKYKYMFGGLFEVPIMMRMIVGRSWGQGAQHSQSLQSLLAHIPGLVVVMPSSPKSIIQSYKYAIEKHRSPVIMLEHRLLYEISFEDNDPMYKNVSMFGSVIARIGKDLTIVATSIMVLESKRAAQYLERFGLDIEIIDLNSISHPDESLIIESVRKTGRLLVCDTSWKAYGVAAEINRIINEHDPKLLKEPSRSLSMQPSPCPTAKVLEEMYYPDMKDIVSAAINLIKGDMQTNIELPKKESMTSYYKHFKGPF
ncbi:Pyruvate dehydrogenase E1 component subunit beta [Prochlorococcus marinus str. MIT 1342]|uniref:alpha-ketoacid dehydrogenase subunit beta n=1 Tax=Prochlorococcus TaxID=1218 RepID=UPI0007B3A31C|nr:transketolase C-terminal domain-containing protein [Prochlorococcus marinus]KZR79914.1 Pyruvate dehydrogenase E1 component subunit beta [Prochlorococcus marinus str. MIT 1342]